ncbi:MAG TPA: V-type ATP synthase subunit D [Thermoanaerobaculia bacterium]|nr:V-type ATP synthase subunit D [Thermoanaerobaculia bacterium]
MIASAARSRLFELRRERIAAQRSVDLLEQKREALLRETLRRTVRRDALRRRVDDGYRDARRKLDIARVELGMRAIEAAALAQQPQHAIVRASTSVMGIQIPRLTVTVSDFRAQYGAAATSCSLDDAGCAFHDVLTDAIALAEEDCALSRLRAATRKTGKLLNALKKIVVPRIEREIRFVLEGIEEEERDEALRRTVWRRSA